MMMFTQGEEMLPRPVVMDRRWKPNVEISPNCPRCNSSNTKFCYYNNYSLTQPRYFCKGCRRYWTKGGSLRNVPIGGGCRKNRRGKSLRISSNDCVSINGNSSIRRTAPPAGTGILPDDSMGSAPNNPPTSHDDSSNSTIDLALVYAKFLNQQQPANSDPGFEIPNELPSREFDSSSLVLSKNISDPNVQFSLEQYCILGCSGTSKPCPDTIHLSEGHQVLISEFELNYKQQERISDSTSMETSNYGLLQPLPTDELVVQDMLWSNSPVMAASDFTWKATQLQGFQPVPDGQYSTHHLNPLEDNWSSFDLPSFEAFSRP